MDLSFTDGVDRPSSWPVRSRRRAMATTRMDKCEQQVQSQESRLQETERWQSEFLLEVKQMVQFEVVMALRQSGMNLLSNECQLHSTIDMQGAHGYLSSICLVENERLKDETMRMQDDDHRRSTMNRLNFWCQ